MRNVKETLQWYENHPTSRELGFNPDNMCLKICRTARNIPARYPTAKAAQDATPREHRIEQVRHLRKGMVLYYDDPTDGNRAGHVATMIGRVKGFNPDSLADVLTITNSVHAGRLTVVRGDYFPRYWGDPFQFGATWLNGYELEMIRRKTAIEKFHDEARPWDVSFLDKAAKGRPEIARIRDGIVTQVNRLPDSPKLERVREFKDSFRAERHLRMWLLNESIRDGHTGLVKKVRNNIRRLINELPEE